MINGIFSTLTEMFSYTFLVRAFIVGALVSVCAALLGTSLVLKRYSMIGDGLSHVGFGALALATALNMTPLAVSIPIVITAAFLLLRLGEKSLLKGDAAIALISAGSLAVGVIIISQTTGMNTDVCNYLFGSILAMNKNDVYLSVILSIVVLVLFILFYHKLFAITFDETYAKATGVKTGLYNMLIAFLTAVTIVLGMRVMGAMLISALIIFPALTSMRIFKTWRSVTVCSVCVSAVCYFSGITASYVYAMPSGASVVLVNIIAFALFWIINLLKKKTFMKKLRFMGIALLLLLCGCKDRTKAILSAGQDLFYGQEETAWNAVTPQVKENVTVPGKRNTGSVADKPIIEIKEKMFLAQTNDVYLNPDEYMGKTLKLEGIFKREQYGGQEYCFVLRYGPGCCGNDNNAGFEIAWDETETQGKTRPAVDDWVGVTGVLKSYQGDGYPYLYIALTGLKVLRNRGAEFVTQ